MRRLILLGVMALPVLVGCHAMPPAAPVPEFSRVHTAWSVPTLERDITLLVLQILLTSLAASISR